MNVENAFLDKNTISFCVLYHIGQFFSKFQQKSDFLKKLNLISKKTFWEILPFYPHFTSNLLLFPNFRKLLCFSKDTFFEKKLIERFEGTLSFRSHSIAKLVTDIFQIFRTQNKWRIMSRQVNVKPKFKNARCEWMILAVKNWKIVQRQQNWCRMWIKWFFSQFFFDTKI